MTTITPVTTVKDAVMSSKAARELFIAHGIDPLERCIGMHDLNTLGNVEDWCHVTDVEGLIRELNQAIASEASAPTAGPSALAAPGRGRWRPAASSSAAAALPVCAWPSCSTGGVAEAGSR
jgi:hypothetical protein